MLKNFPKNMECLPTHMPESKKSRHDYGDIFPRDPPTMLSFLLGGIWKGGSAPRKIKSVFFTGKF